MMNIIKKKSLNESKVGDVTVTHEGGTNVYTASRMDDNKDSEASESMVDHEDTSYNRRDGNQLHVENSSTGYSLALGHQAESQTESGKPILEEQETVQDSTVSANRLNKNLFPKRCQYLVQ